MVPQLSPVFVQMAKIALSIAFEQKADPPLDRKTASGGRRRRVFRMVEPDICDP